MGFVAALIIGVAVGLIFLILFKPKMPQQEMSPATLDSFNITQATEGAVISEVYGRIRLPGNIIWYGNLVTEEIIQEAGGKGGGSQQQVVGYNYYLDVWQAICIGKISIIKTYVQDNEQVVSASSIDFNDGTGATYPTEPGPFANKVGGVAHVFYDRMYLGENVTFVPTVHFIVEKDMSGNPVNSPSLTKGVNPAAIIYDLLINAGAIHADINMTRFNAAADYWAAVDYGLNINFSSQSKLRDKVAQVLGYVGGAWGVDENNQYYIIAFDPNAATVATMVKEDFLEFTFTRKSWSDTINEFKANYVDENKDFTRRTLVARNSANIQLQGRKKQRSVDLTAFRDTTIASARLWEIMKTESYPDAQINFKTNMEYAGLNVGEVIEVSHDEYGISSAEFRVIKKDITEVDKNELGWQAVQMVETLFDDSFQNVGGSSWVVPDYDPDPLVYQAAFELPYNPITEGARAFLMLAARVNSFESGWTLLFSNAGVDYSTMGNHSGWAQYGTLDEAYPIDTYEIDDEVGILFTPYREDPEFGSISRADLFNANRYCIIGSEIMRFQNINPEGVSSFRLTGVIRGRLNTTVAAHASSAPIWLFSLSENILTGISSDDFYLKYLPFFAGTTVDAGLATPIHVQPIGKAQTPWPLTRIEVVRSGANLTAIWWPTGQDVPGGGRSAPDAQTDQYPFSFLGDFEYQVGAGTITAISDITVGYVQAGSHQFQVRHRKSGNVGPWTTLTVGAADGTYVG